MSDAAPSTHTASGQIAHGTYHDGLSAEDVPVLLHLDSARLVVSALGGEEIVRVPLSRMRRITGESRRGQARFRLSPRGRARLTVTDVTAIARLEHAARHLRGEGIFSVQRIALALGISAGTVAVSFALFLLAVPLFADDVAKRLPAAWEEDFGKRIADAIVEDMAYQVGRTPEEAICRGVEGEAALQKMLDHILRGTEPPMPITVRVVDIDAVNAFAAPGGQIIIFRGLIGFAQDPDEVAGVLAHEIAHVNLRHPVRGLLEQQSLTILLSLVVGDYGGREVAYRLGQILLFTHYSRDAEREADALALDIMQKAKINTGPLAKFMNRIAFLSGEGNELGWLDTHPLSRERARTFEQAGAPKLPTLTTREFAALKKICNYDEWRPADRLPKKD